MQLEQGKHSKLCKSMWGFSEAEVYFMSSFYSVAAMDGQTAEHLQKAICKFSRNDVLCMEHNRGWGEAASMFSGALVELKTSNAALLEASGRTWEEGNFFRGNGVHMFLFDGQALMQWWHSTGRFLKATSKCSQSLSDNS